MHREFWFLLKPLKKIQAAYTFDRFEGKGRVTVEHTDRPRPLIVLSAPERRESRPDARGED